MNMNIEIKKKFHLFKKRKKYRKLQTLKGDYDNVALKFIFKDGSIQLMNTNPSFFIKNNKEKHEIGDILKNVNSLKHDLGAVDYEILTN